MRLIDADAVYDVLNDIYCDSQGNYNKGIGFAIDVILGANDVDAEHVRHGRWAKSPHAMFFLRCSECKAANTVMCIYGITAPTVGQRWIWRNDFV